MNVKQAAEKIGCQPSLVYKLMGAGKLAHRRIGFGRGKIVIEEVHVNDYIRSCQVDAATTQDETPRRGRRPAGVRVPDVDAVIQDWESRRPGA